MGIDPALVKRLLQKISIPLWRILTQRMNTAAIRMSDSAVMFRNFVLFLTLAVPLHAQLLVAG